MSWGSAGIAVCVAWMIGAGAPALAPTPGAPRNDNHANGVAIGPLPASLDGTTVGATVETNEPFSSCGVTPGGSVWYSISPAAAERIALQVVAAGTPRSTST